jgi:hypothetical protein
MKILMSGRLTFIAFLFLFWDVRFQVSVFSAAAGLKSGQFNYLKTVPFWRSFIRGYAIVSAFPDTRNLTPETNFSEQNGA